MEKSFLHFKASHPDWQPDPASSVFLDRLRDQYAGADKDKDRDRSKSLGLGVDERSSNYDRAWAKSSHLLRGRLAGVGAVQEEDEDGEVEEEDQEEEEDDEEEEGMDGWNKRVGGKEDVGDEGDEGFLRDVGMVGLLQQVLNR